MHPGLVTGAFTLLDFRPPNATATPTLPSSTPSGLTGELYLDKPHEVQRYRDAHAAILGCALDEGCQPWICCSRWLKTWSAKPLPFPGLLDRRRLSAGAETHVNGGAPAAKRGRTMLSASKVHNPVRRPASCAASAMSMACSGWTT